MHGLKLNYLHCFCCCLAFIKHLLCTKRWPKHTKESQPSKRRHLNICILSIEQYTYVGCGACGCFKYLIIQCPNLIETLDFKSLFHLLQNHVDYTWHFRGWEKCLQPTSWVVNCYTWKAKSCSFHQAIILCPEAWDLITPYHHLSLHRYRCY